MAFIDTVADVTPLVRALLGDKNSDIAADADQYPFLNAAYRDLQRLMAENGIRCSVKKDTKDIAASSTEVTLGKSTSPALPADLVLPYYLWEKRQSSTDLYVPMHERPRVPQRDPTTTLIHWTWAGNAILFVGATQAMTVKIEYEARLPKLDSTDDQIQIEDGIDAIAQRTAWYFATRRGWPNAQVFFGNWRDEVKKLLNRDVRRNQNLAFQRRPYGVPV